jgi:hypothetical protein
MAVVKGGDAGDAFYTLEGRERRRSDEETVRGSARLHGEERKGWQPARDEKGQLG